MQFRVRVGIAQDCHCAQNDESKSTLSDTAFWGTCKEDCLHHPTLTVQIIAYSFYLMKFWDMLGTSLEIGCPTLCRRLKVIPRDQTIRNASWYANAEYFYLFKRWPPEILRRRLRIGQNGFLNSSSLSYRTALLARSAAALMTTNDKFSWQHEPVALSTNAVERSSRCERASAQNTFANATATRSATKPLFGNIL